jgi:hypothetical protein
MPRRLPATVLLFAALLGIAAGAGDADRIGEFYPPVPFATVADGQWKRPRARIVGTVKSVRKEEDGDVHITLVDAGKLVVLEIIPELKLRPPRKGDRIAAWGVVREDAWHGWTELHPLIGWEPVVPPRRAAQ